MRLIRMDANVRRSSHIPFVYLHRLILPPYLGHRLFFPPSFSSSLFWACFRLPLPLLLPLFRVPPLFSSQAPPASDNPCPALQFHDTPSLRHHSQIFRRSLPRSFWLSRLLH